MALFMPVAVVVGGLTTAILQQTEALEVAELEPVEVAELEPVEVAAAPLEVISMAEEEALVP